MISWKIKRTIRYNFFGAELLKFKDAVTSVFYKGKGKYCPVCNKSSRKFGTYGVANREDAKCMQCGALERHRLAWIFLNRKTGLFKAKPKKVLHIAPEPIFEKLFKKKLNGEYITADLYDSHAMIKMDITHIQYDDNTFDMIFCSHVLEHVQDDKKAMREFNRVLKNDGWALLLVPITAEKTVEDSSITAPAERLKLFGQEDHVRRYGPDYVDRLKKAGFNVDIFTPSSFLNEEEITKMGITKDAGEIYYCTIT